MKKAIVKTFCFGLLPALVSLRGCQNLPKAAPGVQTSSPQRETAPSRTPVDVAQARAAIVREAPTFIGTTRPEGEVSLRSRVEGRLLSLSVNIGDRVARGQIVAQLDDAILATAVTQAQAELAALESEVVRAQTQVSNAKARAEQARVQLKQAQKDTARRQFLWQEGAISQQEAELAQTAAQSAEQTLRAAIEQIRSEQQAVAAASGRVAAQKAAVAQTKERLSYVKITSPINGIAIARVNEPGNLVQPGGEILKLGDFSRVEVEVQVPDKEISNIRIGQSVQVQLDAFPNQIFTGTVARIYPAANQTFLQVPVEIVIPNSNGKIGNQLLARVRFSQPSKPRVTIPQTALLAASERGREERGGREKLTPSSPQFGTVFVVTGERNEAKANARRVQLGASVNGNVEILSGLRSGERYVVRSGKPLKDGDAVRLSILSEK